MNVYDYLLSAAGEVPDRTGIEFQGQSLTYAQLADEASRIAAAMRSHGIEPGDSVGIMLPNLPQFVTALYGTLMNGAVIVPMNVLLRPPEIRYLIEDSGMQMIFVFGFFLPAVQEAIRDMSNPPAVVVLGGPHGEHVPFGALLEHDERVEPRPADDDTTAMIIYTSGTTGKPKGALITNGNILANLQMVDEVLVPSEDDKFLCVLPLFHVFALNGILNGSIRNRIPVVLHTKFEIDKAVQSLQEDGITLFAGVPTMYFYVLKYEGIENVVFPTLRYCISGGAAMPVEVMRQFEEQFGVPIFEGFGLTETTVSVCMNRPDGLGRKPGSIGLPFKGVEMRVVDEEGHEVANGEIGEIVIRSPNVMKGYLNKPEATAEAIRDGWFYSGDLGYRDDDGYFYVVDRKKDMIIKGGYNIYPREIEEVIYQLPQVAEVAVVGIFDEAKGEAVRAVIAPKPGQELTEEQVRAHVEENLAKYKWPQDYLFINELPKGPTGKILKREIKQNWAQWNKDRARAAAPAGAE